MGSERGMLTRLWQGLDPNTLILHHTAVIVMLMVDQINTLNLNSLNTNRYAINSASLLYIYIW